MERDERYGRRQEDEKNGPPIKKQNRRGGAPGHRGSHLSGKLVNRALADHTVSPYGQRASDQLEEARQRRQLLCRQAARADADRPAAEQFPNPMRHCEELLDASATEDDNPPAILPRCSLQPPRRLLST
jgi:hypothetical protein